MDLTTLLRRHEGKTLEFKRDLSSPAPIMKTIVAFANTAGGELVIGVDDESRDVVGVPEPLDEEERLSNLIADRITPPIIPDVEIAPWGSRNVLIVRIADSQLRPHHIRAQGAERGVYVRVGSTSRRAGPELVRELSRFADNRAFDEEPYPEVSSEAIDFRAASESFRGVRELRPSDLETLRIFTRYQGRRVPTAGGVILFGEARLEHFPDAWIRIGLFGGRDRSKVLDSKDVTSYPPVAVEEALVQFGRMTGSRIEIEGPRHRTSPAYPPAAIREAVINAVVHADYSQRGTPISIALFTDRIEVENPGLLPFGLTIEDIREGTSKLRNRVIGRVFKELGFIEQWGSGIQRMTSACLDAGLGAPILEERAVGFRVTIHGASVAGLRLDPLDKSIMEALEGSARSGGLATSEIATSLGRSDRATRTRLLRLADLGLVVRIATGRNDPKARWLPSDR